MVETRSKKTVASAHASTEATNRKTNDISAHDAVQIKGKARWLTMAVVFVMLAAVMLGRRLKSNASINEYGEMKHDVVLLTEIWTAAVCLWLLMATY